MREVQLSPPQIIDNLIQDTLNKAPLRTKYFASTPLPMANISSLAAELLNQISQYVYNPEDILCFSLVNKRLFSIMQPTLKQAKAWHRIYISPMDAGFELLVSENPDHVDPVRAILRNIIQLSERHRYWVLHYAENLGAPLAHSTTTFRSIRQSALEAYARDPNARSIVISDGKLFTEAAKHMGLSHVDGLMSSLQSNIRDAHLALLLSICPNLRSISFAATWRGGTVEKCWSYAADHHLTTPNFQDCVTLPSMRSINAPMYMNYFPEESVKLIGQAKTSTVTDITVTKSALDEATVSLMLQWPQALKRFHFEQAGAWSVGQPFTPTKFAKALASQAESLEVLEIPDLAGNWFCTFVASEVDGPNQFTLRSFHEFRSLRILNVRFDLLLGEKYAIFNESGIGQRYRSTNRLVDLLPQSIEELTLHGMRHTFDSDRHIRELATHTKVCLPALRSFVLRPDKQYMRTPEESKSFEKYKVLFAKVNVSFVVDEDNMDIYQSGM